VVGVFGQCLTSRVEKITDLECQALVSVVAVEGGHVGAIVDDQRLQETLNKLTQVSDAQISIVSRSPAAPSSRVTKALSSSHNLRYCILLQQRCDSSSMRTCIDGYCSNCAEAIYQ